MIDMGHRAAQMLLDLIQKPEEEQSSIVLPTELIVRESTNVPATVNHS
jgi:DNA-binding LacI/PurR family transcriptional regulator